MWADILTRPVVESRIKVKSLRLSRLFYAPITPSTEEEYDWTTRKEISEVHQKTKENPSQDFDAQHRVIHNNRGAFCIPQEEELLHLHIIIAARTGRGGHCGLDATKRVIKEHFYWKNITKDVDIFVKFYLHCLCTETGDVVPRPTGHSLHTEGPNEILPFDFCYIGNVIP